MSWKKSSYRLQVASHKSQVRFYLLFAIYYLLSLSGCGYTTTTIPKGDIKTIHVELFRNNIDITKETSAKDKYEIYRPNLEVDIRDAIIERIFLDGHLKVSKRDSADSVLEGELVGYRKDPLRYRDESITEYRISIACNIKLKKPATSEILMEDTITGDNTYFTIGSLAKTETEALSDTYKDLARRIVDRIVDNW